MFLILFDVNGKYLNYSLPIVIDNGITKSEYPFLYDPLTNLIIYGYTFSDNNSVVTIMHNDGTIYSKFNIDDLLDPTMHLVIQSIVVTNNKTLYVLTGPNCDIYEYDLIGRHLNTFKCLICKNYKPDQILLCKNTNNYYVTYYYPIDEDFMSVVVSYDNNHNVISQISFHHRTENEVPVRITIGNSTGNLLISSYRSFSAYNNKLELLYNQTVPVDKLYPFFSVREIVIDHEILLVYFWSNMIFTYDYYGNFKSHCTSLNSNYDDTQVIMYDNRYIYIDSKYDSKHNQQIVYINQDNVECNTVDIINFGDFGGSNGSIISLHNEYVFIDQSSGSIITNVNSKIKIWQ